MGARAVEGDRGRPKSFRCLARNQTGRCLACEKKEQRPSDRRECYMRIGPRLPAHVRKTAMDVLKLVTMQQHLVALPREVHAGRSRGTRATAYAKGVDPRGTSAC
jgi:hypothetical protein